MQVTASRLLETSWGPGYHRQAQQNKRQEFKMSYERALDELRRHFIKLVNSLLTPPSAAEVRLVVLQDIGKLCSLFGHQICKNHILPIVITFLNDPDVSLRVAFFECIVDLARCCCTLCAV